MIFAALGDILGNMRALSAVLDHLEEQGVMVILQTGNLFDGGENAAAVVDLLRERGVKVVQGSMDRLLVPRRADRLERADPRRAAMMGAHAALRSGQVEWVCDLSWKTRLEYENLHIVLCHGSLTSRAEVLDGATSTLKLRRQREISPVDIVVSGGAAEPFARLVDGTLFVCPGVLCPTPGRARYALISTEATPWRVNFPELAIHAGG